MTDNDENIYLSKTGDVVYLGEDSGDTGLPTVTIDEVDEELTAMWMDFCETYMDDSVY